MRWPARFFLPVLAIGLLLFCPIAAGTHTALRVPLLYRRVDLKSREPTLLTLDLPAADYQIEPASLGYFADTPAGSPRQFIYSADVPRGLIYAQLPPGSGGFQPPNSPGGKDAAATGPGSVVVLELAGPSGEVFFDDDLKTIRANVSELNRRHNMLLLAQKGAAGSYRNVLDALWQALIVTPQGVRANGWLDAIMAKYPADVPRIAAALGDDARMRCDQKDLFYTAEQARLKLLLSQFDLQLALARVPHERSAELLSLGDEKLVRSTMLDEINQIGQSWATRAAELQSDIATGTAQLAQLTATPDSQPSTQSLAASVDPRNLVVVPPDPGPALATVSPRQGLERALVAAWLSVEQRELTALQTSLPLLDSARQHVSATAAPDWSSRPTFNISLASFRSPELDSLKYSGALDGGVTPRTAASLLGGLAQEFESPPAATGPGRLADIFDPQAQRDDVLLRLSGAKLSVSPDELCYGLLTLERCTPRASEPVTANPAGTASAAGGASAGDATAASFRVAGSANSAAAPAPKLSAPEERGEADLAARAGLAAQLDLVLGNPDSRGLAAYDLAYLKFMRWYAGLSLPGSPAPAVAAGTVSSDKLKTQSFGFKTK